MLKKLHIKNVAGISDVNLEFKSGLNVITGESGSGKSSIVRSLEILCSPRLNNRYMRAGENTSEVTAEIDNKIITREISLSGRSKTELNGKKVTSNTISTLMKDFMKIQSQFANLDLLKPEKQLDIIDSCLSAEDKNLISEYTASYEQLKKSESDLELLKKLYSETEAKYSKHEEILKLMEVSKPESNLQYTLESELSDILHDIKIHERALLSLNVLTGGLSGEGLLNSMNSELKEIYVFLSDEEQENITEFMDNLEDIFRRFRNFGSKIEQLNRKRESVERRLGSLRRLKRITNISDEDELKEFCVEADRKIKWLKTAGMTIEDNTLKNAELKKRTNELAFKLRKARKDSAKDLSERVNLRLNTLGMSDIDFYINFSELNDLQKNGLDEAEFMLKGGKRTGRVERIASGGELSRLLLALQMSLPEEYLTPTIIFDEVEAGLGGRAAVLTGLQLKELSKSCQVILVTHEASIAALGDVHILVSREGNESIIKTITGENRVQEIARMLSGNPDITEALEHARILLNAERESD